jgi:hypothetical protein
MLALERAVQGEIETANSFMLQRQLRFDACLACVNHDPGDAVRRRVQLEYSMFVRDIAIIVSCIVMLTQLPEIHRFVWGEKSKTIRTA